MISAGTLASFLSVSTNQIEQNVDGPQERLAKILALRGNHATERQLADAYWEVNDLTNSSKIWNQLWKECRNEWTSASQKDFSEIARNYSAVSMEAGSFDLALKSINTALEYDQKFYGLRSKETARDLNNLAICEYFKGCSEEKPFERASKFKLAQLHCQESNALWQELNCKESAFNIKNNNDFERLIARDLKQAESAGQPYDVSRAHAI